MLNKIANTSRLLSADAIDNANSGHPGLPVGCAEIGAVLYGEIMNFDPQQPDWENRDRFILSAGHGSMLQYSFLHLSRYDLSLNELKNFRNIDSKTPGHPEYQLTPGVETTTGPLGQGFANAVGMALGEKMKAAKFNTKKYKIIDHYIYVLIGDGGMMEGISSEAASLAGHLGLEKLIVFYDDNNISIEGSTDISFTEDVAQRFKAYNWHVIEEVDGHNINEIRSSVENAKKEKNRPTLIITQTKIAYGAPTKEGTAEAHGSPLGEKEIEAMKKKFNFPADKKFHIPPDVKDYFKQRQKELNDKRNSWEEMHSLWAESSPELKERWDRSENNYMTKDLKKIIEELEIETPIATRKASGKILNKIADHIEYLIGGSADLSPSTKTYLNNYDEIQSNIYNGRNIRFGVREHAMGSIINGIALYGGFRVYCSTFLVFSDYMRPSIRLAALMNLPIIYIFTHDSIFIGQDGPTHQPVEQLESLRLIPNLEVLRPADSDETKAVWHEALKNISGPTALILSRQNLPLLYKDKDVWSGVELGGYSILSTDSNSYDYNLLASGSEVSTAIQVAHKLINKGKKVNVFSIPNKENFLGKRAKYLDDLISNSKKNIVIEAGVKNGWESLIKDDIQYICVNNFGASGTKEQIKEKYGFRLDQILEKIQ